MREVDEALARAYASREKGDSPQTLPPAPHWPARVSPRLPRPESIATPLPAVELQWPAVVLNLEREWGDRFERMADGEDGRKECPRSCAQYTAASRARTRESDGCWEDASCSGRRGGLHSRR